MGKIIQLKCGGFTAALLLCLLLQLSVGAAALAQAPVISSFSPEKGKAGTQVTINGSNFNPDPAKNIVYFGAVRATVTDASATQLKVTAPAGATYQPISVLNSDTRKTGYAAKPFVLTFGEETNYVFTAGSYAVKASLEATAISAAATAVADFDGDGKQDLGVVNASNSNAFVFRNTPTGRTRFTFANKIDAQGQLLYGARHAATADLNGDGKPDLITGPSNGNYVDVQINTSAGQGALSFTRSAIAHEGYQGVLAMAVGDLDRDGLTDIVVARPGVDGRGLIVLLRNTTDVSTASPATVTFTSSLYTIIGGITSLAIGDVDGNGKPEVIVGSNAGIDIISNLSEPGSFSFSTPSLRLPTPAAVTAVALGDVNGDGRPEVVTTNNTVTVSSTVSVFANNTVPGSITAGNFARTDFSGVANAASLALGDMNGDGKPELVVANNHATTGLVAVLRNRSGNSITTESFVPPVSYSLNNVRQLTIADPDGDNIPDVMAAAGKVYVLANHHGFPDMPTGLVATAGNAQVELSWNANAETNLSHYHLYWGNSANPVNGPERIDAPATNFRHTGLTNGLTYYYRLVAVNRDGDESFSTSDVTAFPWYQVPVITSCTPEKGAAGTEVTLEGANFSHVPANNIVYFGAVRAEVTGGSTTQLKVKVPTGATHQAISVLHKDAGLIAYAAKPFVPVSFPPAPITGQTYKQEGPWATSGAHALAVGDLDGDGKQDLVTANLTNAGAKVSVFHNTAAGKGAFAYNRLPDLDVRTKSAAVALGDVNGDGMLDLVVGNAATSFVSVFLNKSSEGAISFAARMDVDLGAMSGLNDIFAVAIRDLDGDGKADVVVGRNGRVSILRNTSFSTTLISFAAQHFDIPGNVTGIALGDMDGDKKPELALVRSTQHMLSVFRNTSALGTIAFDQVSPTHKSTGVNSAPLAVGLGDVNADGKPDLVTANSGTHSVSVFRNASTGIGSIPFDEKIDFAAGQKPSGIAVGDVDGDGRADLVTAATTSGSAVVLVNKFGTGGIHFEAQANNSIRNALGVAIADPNRDGVADVLGLSASQLIVFANMAAFPAMPQNLAATAGDAQVVLTWSHNTELNLKGYRIYWGNSANPTTPLPTVPAGTNTYTHTGLNNATTYYYRISAISGEDLESELTPDVSAMPKGAPTITFTDVTKTYGDADFMLTSSSSGGGPEKYSIVSQTPYDEASAEVVELTGNTITILRAGTAVLRVTYDETPTARAGSREMTLTVNKKGLSVTLVNSPAITKPYDGTTTATLSASNYSLSGILSKAGVEDKVQLTNHPTTGTYDNANAGTNKTVTAPLSDAMHLVGADAANYTFSGPATGAIGSITKANASITLSNLSVAYDGTAKAATAATNPSGLAVTLSYAQNGSSVVTPTAVGNYDVTAAITDANYTGSATGTLSIRKGEAAVALGSLTHTYDGTSKAAVATTTPAGLTVNISYSQQGNPIASLTNAGTYQVEATVQDANYTGLATGTLTINKAEAAINLPDVTTTYDGTAKVAIATTTPVGLPVKLTYDGSETAPTAAGTYAVEATIQDADYSGTKSGTLTISKATQAIAFTQPGNKTYEDAAFALHAVATSSLPVSFAVVSGPAIVSGNTLTITGAGTVTVKAMQAGNVNYQAAGDVERSFTVGKATPQLVFENFFKPFAERTFTLQATTTSSAPITYRVVEGGTGEVKLSGTRNEIVEVVKSGTVYLRASVDETANYTGASKDAVLTIGANQAPTALLLDNALVNPGAKAEEAIGALATVDPDDSEHTYALASGLGDSHNHLFQISGNKLSLKPDSRLEGLRTFTIRVRSTDPYQNSLEQTFELKVTEKDIDIYNAFSPDGDGHNDVWVNRSLRIYKQVVIEVFDRSGRRLFHTNDPLKGWDGKGLNGEVQQGGFFYRIQIKDIDLVKQGVLVVL